MSTPVFTKMRTCSCACGRVPCEVSRFTTNQNLECTRPVASIFHSLITKPHGTYSIIGSDKSVWHSASVEKGRLLLSLIAPRTTACDQWFQIFCPLRLLVFFLSPHSSLAPSLAVHLHYSSRAHSGTSSTLHLQCTSSWSLVYFRR